MKKLVCLPLASLILAGCSTTPDPAKVCSADWISPRAEKAVSRIESRTKSAVKSVRRAGESLAKGKSPSVFTMMSLSNSFEKLEKELTQGRGITDIKLLAKTCDDPKIVSSAMRDVFERQGVSTKVFDFIENMDFYQSILQKNLKDFQLPTDVKT